MCGTRDESVAGIGLELLVDDGVCRPSGAIPAHFGAAAREITNRPGKSHRTQLLFELTYVDFDVTVDPRS